MPTRRRRRLRLGPSRPSSPSSSTSPGSRARARPPRSSSSSVLAEPPISGAVTLPSPAVGKSPRTRTAGSPPCARPGRVRRASERHAHRFTRQLKSYFFGTGRGRPGPGREGVACRRAARRPRDHDQSRQAATHDPFALRCVTCLTFLEPPLRYRAGLTEPCRARQCSSTRRRTRRCRNCRRARSRARTGSRSSSCTRRRPSTASSGLTSAAGLRRVRRSRGSRCASSSGLCTSGLCFRAAPSSTRSNLRFSPLAVSFSRTSPLRSGRSPLQRRMAPCPSSSSGG